MSFMAIFQFQFSLRGEFFFPVKGEEIVHFSVALIPKPNDDR